MSTPVKTVALKTVGCKLNFAETDTLARAFRERGYRTVPFREPADIYILNTCSVTEHADRDSRKLLRQARRRNPHAFIAVTGCYAQLKPEDVARLPEVNAVFGSAEKLSLIEHLESRDFTRTSISTTPVDRLTTFFPSHSLESRTRAYLKVQDGCDYPCTYCTIPLARGRSRNAPVARLVEEARTIAAAGIREIVLTGVNVGDFGKSTGESLALLLRTLLTETEVPRLRISSIEPNLLTDEILDLFPAFPALMPHIHLPLQSGSDRILRAMKRRYSRAFFEDRVHALRQRLPEAAIGGDVIVGFPGETEADFEETADLLKALDFSYLHIFSYSEREQTPAADLPDPVPPAKKARRSRWLRELAAQKRRRFQERFHSTVRPVLFEYERRGFWWGHTDNYLLVRTASATALQHRIIPVRLAAGGDDFLSGEPVA